MSTTGPRFARLRDLGRRRMVAVVAAGIGIALLATRGTGGEVEPRDAVQDPAAPGAGGELRVRVVDAGSRAPIACTVRLVDAGGRAVGGDAGLGDSFRSTGSFVKTMPPGKARIRVTRGFEYQAVEREVVLEPGAAGEAEIAMERSVDLRRRGWYAGDSHAHMVHGERTVPVDFDQVALAARAEDLQYLSVAHAWALDDPTPERLAKELEGRSTADCVLTWNLEAPKNYYKGDAGRCLGHCWNLGMSGRTPGGADVIATLLNASAADYESDKPTYANFESHALIRAQGGAVFYTHPARWWMGPWGGQGGYPKQERMRVSNMAVELPLDVLAGPTFDGLDVITGGGEIEANRNAFGLWALLLNHGYRLAATASSDACFDRPGGARPGAARIYGFVEGPFSVEGVSRAIAAGRTFATTGPLLVVSLDGRPPGSAIAADGQAHTLRIEAWGSGASGLGLGRVEILRNGRPFQQHVLEDRPGSFEATVRLEERETAWYCVRVAGSDARRDRAISGAFYFEERPWVPPAPVPARVAVRVRDAGSGEAVSAEVVEVSYLGTEPQDGRRHKLAGGAGDLVVPATVRLRAEAEDYEPLTLSPVLDHPPLVEAITGLTDRDLLDWQTFERFRERLGAVELDFAMRKAQR